ncbi:MAG: soluble lytic murein transglycosylase [Clostridia bacterium]|nr:soluble lytic murein transglycosylase [Clostridia bacterium]
MGTLGRRLLLLAIIIALLIYLLPRAGRILYPFTYKENIVEYARVENLDPLLIAAITRVESKFYPLAESDQGARGLMQLMPETAEFAADRLEIPFDPDRLFIPEYNLRLGSWYIARLIDEFGELIPALAAYNGGRSHVHKWLDRGTWDGQTLEQIPFPETREFVRKVLINYRIYHLLYPDVS